MTGTWGWPTGHKVHSEVVFKVSCAEVVLVFTHCDMRGVRSKRSQYSQSFMTQEVGWKVDKLWSGPFHKSADSY